MSEAFWQGFWSNYVWIFLALAVLGAGLMEGIESIVGAWAKGSGQRRERALEREMDALWDRVRQAIEVMVLWQDWYVAVNAALQDRHLEPLPPAPAQRITLDDWPTLQEIRQEQEREREEAIVREEAKRRARRRKASPRGEQP